MRRAHAGITVLSIALSLIVGLVGLSACRHMQPEADDDAAFLEIVLPSLPAGSAEKTESAGSAVDTATNLAAARTGGGGDSEAQPNQLDAPAGLVIAGRVVDKRSGEPITSFDLKVVKRGRINSSSLNQVVVHCIVHDDEGTFRVPVSNNGTYHVHISSSRYDGMFRREIELSEGDERSQEMLFRLDPGWSLTGRVVDDESGEGVPGALVGHTWQFKTGGRRSFSSDWTPWAPLIGFKEACPCAETDDAGRFTLSGLRTFKNPAQWSLIAIAVHPDYAEGRATTAINSGNEVVIRLKHGARISGSVRDDTGKPIAGVMVIPEGLDIHLARPAFSSPDGTFRTAPVLPGEVHLHVGPPPGETAETFGFTREVETVSIGAEDVTVDFGPSDDLVTWRGTLFDRDGEPVAGGMVRANWIGSAPWLSLPLMDHGYSVCDDNGRFARHKLPPGDYLVFIGFPGFSSKLTWDFIRFEKPGVVERDVYIAGATICGTVIDGSTGEPLSSTPCTITAIHSASSSKQYCEAYTDEAGRFCLRGLIPGSFTIESRANGFLDGEKMLIEVEENQRVDDYEIVLDPGGILALNIEGFTKPALATFDICFDDDNGNRDDGGTFSISNSGSLQVPFRLKKGKWTALVCFNRLLFLDRQIVIERNKTTDLIIHPDDLRPASEYHAGDIAISGRLGHFDGEPVPDAFVRLVKRPLPGREPPASLEAPTDRDGRFLFNTAGPGRWLVSVAWEHEEKHDDGELIPLPALVIPQDATDPFSIDLTLPGGSVRGRLIDRLTGAPPRLPETWPALRGRHAEHWDEQDRQDEITGEFRLRAFLRSAQNHHIASCSPGIDGRLHFEWLPPGRYRLAVHARAYVDYLSEPFTLSPGQDLDLGAIALEPAATLLLEVVDAAGSPLRDACITCREAHIFGRHGRRLRPDNKQLFEELPLGSLAITVLARGHGSREIVVDLEPGRLTTRRVVLEAQVQ